MEAELNKGAVAAYSGCGDPEVVEQGAAKRVLDAFGNGVAAIPDALHGAGHWQPNVGNLVDPLMGNLIQVARDIERGLLKPETDGDLLAYILRYSAGLQRVSGLAPDANKIMAIFETGLVSGSGKFRAGLIACTARALMEADRARGHVGMDITNRFLDSILIPRFGTELCQPTSNLRFLTVLGASYAPYIPYFNQPACDVYDAMLRYGDRREVDLALHACAGLELVLKAPDVRASVNYFNFVQAGASRLIESLANLEGGGNPSCSGANLALPAQLQLEGGTVVTHAPTLREKAAMLRLSFQTGLRKGTH